MATIDVTPPTVRLIYEAYAQDSGDWRRAHLGASQIGCRCSRKLWYQFRWATPPVIEGRIYRLFNTGIVEEERIINDLRRIGVHVEDRDAETGKQFWFTDENGHYSGSVDAIALGFQEAPKAWHVVEVKTVGKRYFPQLKKQGVELNNPTHFAQMQQYMAWTKCTRAYYFAVCKDNDEIYAERIKYDAEFVDALHRKAMDIIYGELPSTGADDCKFCDYRDICKKGAEPEHNCRTCAFSNPVCGNKWMCDLDKRMPLAHERMVFGCDRWELRPSFYTELGMLIP